MATLLKILAAMAMVVIVMSPLVVSAQTHHVVGGDGGWESSSPGRVFRVGDKLWFTHPETIVELQSLDEFLSCDLSNPIKMYTDSGSTPVELEKEGMRFFTSGNPDSCKNGLKLPVSVGPSKFDPEFEVPPPDQPEFEIPPPEPFSPSEPEAQYPPPTPIEPPVKPEPEPPVKPEPEPEPAFSPPPPAIEPSASASLIGLSAVVFAGLALSYMGL